MPSASEYREQATILLEEARSLRATDPVTATRLSARADSYLVWATAAELDHSTTDGRRGGTINAFTAPITQQQRQIQPKKEDA